MYKLETRPSLIYKTLLKYNNHVLLSLDINIKCNCVATNLSTSIFYKSKVAKKFL